MRTIPHLLALAGLIALGALGGCDRQKPAGRQGGGQAQTPGAGLDRGRAGAAMPAARFDDPDGRPVRLDDFRGRPLLVNLWATWCAPCVKELPALDSLAARPAAPRVLAISQDSGDPAMVRAFLAQRGLGRLAAYQDRRMALAAELGIAIVPTTILYDSGGRELWRFAGDADWNGKEMAALLAEAG